MPFTLPTIHLNGSGALNLYREYRHALTAVNVAREALASATLHRRDFYPQEPEAWHRAEIERREALLKLQEVEDYCRQWKEHAFGHMPHHKDNVA